MGNWIEGTLAEKAINISFDKVSEHGIRCFVFDYLKRYQNIYFFELLELPYEYLELELGSQSYVTNVSLEDARRSIAAGMYEYCISLNEISEAANRLFNPKPFELSCLLSSLNQVLEAYSCNEDATEFLQREIQYIESQWSYYSKNGQPT